MQSFRMFTCIDMLYEFNLILLILNIYNIIMKQYRFDRVMEGQIL
jgi:hypothetical protein